MTQSLSGIEPVVGCGDDVSLDLSGLAGKAIAFTEAPDPIIAERFESAMEATQLPEPSELPEGRGFRGLRMYGETRGTDETNGTRETCGTDRMDSPPAVVPSAVGRGVAKLPRAAGRDVPIAPPETAECEVVELPRVVGRDVPIAPHPIVYQSIALHADAPQTAMPKVGELRRSEDTPPCRSVSVARDTPPYQRVPASRDTPLLYQSASDTSGQVQVIAPAPLPIELPAAAVQQQQPAAPVTPSDVTRMFVAAAEAVADAILVSSGFENGEGRIHVRLQSEVLSGSEVQITLKNGTLTVVVNPASQDVRTIVEANRTQFEQHLAEKVHSWRIAVAVRRGERTDERV